MNLTATNNISLAEQVAAINRFSKLSILVIWLAGLCSIIVVVVFFFFYLNTNTTSGRHPFSSDEEQLKTADQNFSTDKTTLVNIGLRMQEITTTSESEKSTGSITINKIKYDQQTHTANQQVSKPLFSIKPIPK